MRVALDQTLAQIYKLRRPFSTGPDGKASIFRSGLIIRCEHLLQTPLRNFLPGDLRVMLHQNFYPETLLPLALPLVEQEPLLEADRYPGDLLSSILHQSSDFCLGEPNPLKRTIIITELALSDTSLSGSVLENIKDFKAKLNAFNFNALIAEGHE